jgi:SRSO17 transposase
MDLRDETGTEARFRAYAADLASVLGHADRVRPFEDYCVGLLAAEGRKSVEPLAAVTAPERTAAQHQSLLHLVAQAPWSDQAMLRRVRERVVPSITRDEPIQAWIIDDTGFPKKGRLSVGVARQYCGQLVTYAPTLDTICIEKSHQIIAGMMIASVIRQAAAVAARPIRVR